MKTGSFPFASIDPGRSVDSSGHSYQAMGAGVTSWARPVLIVALTACTPRTSTLTHELSTTTVTIVHSFAADEGYAPRAGLVLGTDGQFYGTTWKGGNGGGTVYAYDPVTGAYRVIHDFTVLDSTGRNTDGYGSVAPVSFGPDGRIYGTTRQGGRGGNTLRPAPGLVFSCAPVGDDCKTLHEFTGGTDGGTPSGGLVWSGSTAYGINNSGVIYRWDGTFTVAHYLTSTEGRNPYGSPTFGGDGRLYWWANWGGANGAGAVASWSPTPAPTTGSSLYDFAPYTIVGNSDNAPLQSLALTSDGALWGTSEFGGSGSGLVYKVERTLTAVHEFAPYVRAGGVDGAMPISTPIEGPDGKVWGTSYYGGPAGTGTIWRVGRDGRGFEVVYSFPTANSGNGCYPATGLTRGADGALYGTTFLCGAAGGGTIYRVSLGS